MYQTFIARRSCMPIGTVVFHAGAEIPDHMLLCDGSEVDQDDYPLLFDAIGDTYGSAAAGYFRLPDLIDAIPYGGNIVDLGTDVGVNDLILTLNQIPSHAHLVSYVNIGLTMVTPGTGPILTISDAGYIDSGSAGGGESFDNRQAGVTMLPCIVAR
jgi:microcystin-dependent protein